MPYALFLKLDGIDITFLGGAVIIAMILIFSMNPLSSWVGKLLDYQKEKDRKSRM
jgi:hypothetical protein